MPVYYTAAFEFESAKAMGDAFCGRSMAPSYARIANPTVTYLEERVRQQTGATSVTALNTGMAAIHYALTAVSAAGRYVVAASVGGMIEPADAILISAKNGDGLDRLKAEISRRVAALRHRTELVIPYAKGNVLSLIHGKGQVLSEEYTDEGTRVVCLMDAALYQKVASMLGGGA